MYGKWEAQQQIAQRVSQIIGSMFTRAILQGKNFADVLSDIGNMILEMGLNFLIGGGIGSLFGGDFVTAGLSQLGIKLANGGVINEPVAGIGLKSGQSYAFAEAGYPEIVMPLNKINSIGGGSQNVNMNFKHEFELKLRSSDLYASIKMQKRIEEKYT